MVFFVEYLIYTTNHCYLVTEVGDEVDGGCEMLSRSVLLLSAGKGTDNGGWLGRVS